MELTGFGEKEFQACCGSTQFAKEMALSSPFLTENGTQFAKEMALSSSSSYIHVDVNGWLEAFSAHPQIGQTASSTHKGDLSAQWSKGEQATALTNVTDSKLQELADWNLRYRQKFGFIFLICASGKSTSEILDHLKARYPNRPIVEFEIAAKEQMKITELRLAKLFLSQSIAPLKGGNSINTAQKAEEGRVSIIGGHLTATPESTTKQTSTRTRPPITTHVLDVARGSPASGIDVQLEMWNGNERRPSFGNTDKGNWLFIGSSKTDNDGRSGQLMSIVDSIPPGIYRISFNTGEPLTANFNKVVYNVFHCKHENFG